MKEKVIDLTQKVVDLTKTRKTLSVKKNPKELWQMTKEDYVDYLVRLSEEKPELAKDIIKIGNKWKVFGYKEKFKNKRDAIKFLFKEHERKREGRTEHSYYVKRAISEGKPVPIEVLRDYPDLQKQATEARKVEAEEKVRQLPLEEKPKKLKPTEKIIGRDIRGRPGWTATYTEAEQLVTVRDNKGNIIGQEDPFPAGVPADKKQQKRRIEQAIGDILWVYEREQIQKIRLT